MDLHLTPDLHDRGIVRVFVHGVLVAEYCAGLTHDRDRLVAEVTAARALRALAREVRQWAASLDSVQVPKARAETRLGRDDGLANSTGPHPDPGVLPLPPGQTAAYRAGYAQGQALRRCLAVVEGAEEKGGQDG